MNSAVKESLSAGKTSCRKRPGCLPLRIEKIRYREWPEAWRCTVGTLELIVVCSIGPRILSFRLAGGENLLYEDTTDFRVGEWRLYGGHRFTTAPESEASYVPDNEPCDVVIGRKRLLVRGTASKELLLCLDIRRAASNLGFEVRHSAQNRGIGTWHGALWAITCVKPGEVIIPWTGCPERFWTGPERSYASPTSGQWRRAKDHFVVEPNGQKGKVGFRSFAGCLALSRPGATLVVRGPELLRTRAYPDGGCNVEVFTCPNYLELETLGPLLVLKPGQEAQHVETWHILPNTVAPCDWHLVDQLTRPSRPRKPRLSLAAQALAGATAGAILPPAAGKCG